MVWQLYISKISKVTTVKIRQKLHGNTFPTNSSDGSRLAYIISNLISLTKVITTDLNMIEAAYLVKHPK